jgi:DNA-directed RNA polymerase specialized sigma24 family protein
MEDTIFPPTHWSAVLEAAGAEPDKARRAFEALCGYYRDAIVQWMRLQRLTSQDAEDAAHDFLQQWLRRENPLQGFQRRERRFREFLRVCLRRYLADWRARHRADRRGGGAEHIPLEESDWIGDDAESSLACLHLDFALATQIHRGALAKLKTSWQTKLAGEGFDRLQSVALGDSANPGFAKLAEELGVAVGTVKSWVFRLRREYHEAFRDAVSRQADPSLIDEDVMHLHRLLLHPPSGAPDDSLSPQRAADAVSGNKMNPLWPG